MAAQTRFELDPNRVAYCEAHGWRAYYDRKWPVLLGLVVQLCQAQFGIPFPVSLMAAYYVTRASVAWVPVDHDIAKVQAYYEKFYRLAWRYAGLTFDPARAAALETRYNEVHRQLVLQPDKSEFIQALTELHCELFRLSAQQARESAEWRVQANNTVDLISNHISQDVAGDWARIEDYLRRCYQSISREMAANRRQAPSSVPAEGVATS